MRDVPSVETWRERWSQRWWRLVGCVILPDMTADWILGTWRLLRADPSLDFAPGVRMEFRPDGALRYHVDVGGRDQVIDLVYRLEDDVLHTDNPSAPHSTSVRVVHGEADVMLLDFGGAHAMLIREHHGHGP